MHNAAQQGLPLSHATVISQAKLKTRQIQVDRDTVMNHYPIAYLTEKQIVVKAALANQLVGDVATDRPKTFCFLGMKNHREEWLY